MISSFDLDIQCEEYYSEEIEIENLIFSEKIDIIIIERWGEENK